MTTHPRPAPSACWRMSVRCPAPVQVAFIKEAIDTVIRCREILKWTYVFAFFEQVLTLTPTLTLTLLI